MERLRNGWRLMLALVLVLGPVAGACSSSSSPPNNPGMSGNNSSSGGASSSGAGSSSGAPGSSSGSSGSSSGTSSGQSSGGSGSSSGSGQTGNAGDAGDAAAADAAAGLVLDGAAPMLSAIPGQDTSKVGASGPPLTALPDGGTNLYDFSQAASIAAAAVAGATATGFGLPARIVADSQGGIDFAVSGMGKLDAGSIPLVEVTRLDATLTPSWTALIPNMLFTLDAVLNSTDIAADQNGNVFVVGAPGGDVFTDPPELVQVLSTGKVGWTATLLQGSTTGARAATAQVVSDGTIWVLGTASGQLPNQPSTAKGGGWLWHVGTDGSTLSVIQSTALSATDSWAALGTGFLIDQKTEHLARVDLNLNPVWTQGPGTAYDLVALSPDGTLVWDYPQPSSTALPLFQFSAATGAPQWVRDFATETVTVNSAEGATWKGSFGSVTAMLAASDGLYLTGTYQNTYQNGSSPPPNTQTLYLAKLDTTGSQIWFQQYQGRGGPKPQSLALQGTKLAVLDGNGFIFEVNTADGSGP